MQRFKGVVRNRRGRDVLVEERTSGRKAMRNEGQRLDRVIAQRQNSEVGRWAKWDNLLAEELAKLND